MYDRSAEEGRAGPSLRKTNYGWAGLYKLFLRIGQLDGETISWSKPERQGLNLFLLHYQFAILDFHRTNIVRKF